AGAEWLSARRTEGGKDEVQGGEGPRAHRSGPRRSQTVPAPAGRASILPSRRYGSAAVAAMRPIEAAAELQGPAVLRARLPPFAPVFEDGGEVGVHHGDVGSSHFDALELVRRLVEHLQLEVDSTQGRGDREVVGGARGRAAIQRDHPRGASL